MKSSGLDRLPPDPVAPSSTCDLGKLPRFSKHLSPHEGEKSSSIMRLFWGWNELKHIKCLVWSRADRKYSELYYQPRHSPSKPWKTCSHRGRKELPFSTALPLPAAPLVLFTHSPWLQDEGRCHSWNLLCVWRKQPLMLIQSYFLTSTAGYHLSPPWAANAAGNWCG